VTFAQAAAALAVSRGGVQDAMPRRAEVERLLGENN
jgi:ribokinase